MARIAGREYELGPHHPHGSNILSKLTDRDITRDAAKNALIQEIAGKYVEWRDAAVADDEPTLDDQEAAHIARQTTFYQDYRNLLDDERVDAFDSRGALQSSALEEFCFFLFRPLLEQYGDQIAIGHHEVFHGLYFTARNFAEFAEMPRPMYPVGNLDFVIGKKLTSRFIAGPKAAEQTIYVPAVAVECKTYLDRPRYIESDILARNVKHGFPRCLYVVISEFLKLDVNKVNLHGSPVDRIYVFRRSQNIDRKVRRRGRVALPPIYTPAVADFYRNVKEHLAEDWAAPEDWTATGILK